MGDFEQLGELLITNVLPLLNFTPAEIKKIKNGDLKEDITDSGKNDG